MGVPAFFRWLSEKYPRTVIDMVEQRPAVIDGITIPVDASPENPNGMEFDNLYIDMNGVIHPCSHPEDRPAPTTEEEMFYNVMVYVDRIFAAVRPRKLLFLAIDGVAPRAKMNQQRTRRFRAAGDARERHEIKQQTRREMLELGLPVPPEELDKEWDSNVITPGTQFMINLAKYIRYYIADRINTNKAWQCIQVIFSDGSEPGEGEHKIMDYIRKQRAQPGYNPNLRHILHGLDADLIMLALATHEPHFTILREQVLFGRRARDEPRKTAAQEAYDTMTGMNSGEGMGNSDYVGFPFMKPFQMLNIPILREYLQEEFKCLRNLPFGHDFERIIDDFVFLCFFVGNDFLPHLPSLDIRDGAIDFLVNVYKRVLPAMGSYLTNSGGDVNLEKVDIILSEVGRVEDEVFRRRKSADVREQERFSSRVRHIEKRHGGSAQELGQRMVSEDVRPLGKQNPVMAAPPMPMEPARIPVQPAAAGAAVVVANGTNKNMEVAQALREALKKKRKKSETTDEQVTEGQQAQASTGGLVQDEQEESPAKRIKAERGWEGEGMDTAVLEGAAAKDNGNFGGGDALVGDQGEGEDEMLEEENGNGSIPKDDELEDDPIQVPVVVPPELVGTELAEAQKALAARVKAKHESKLDQLREEIEDSIKLHEAGWKERYYKDKLKKQNVESGGGQPIMFRTYIEGLCWVYQYYYRGCPSWDWYYPFHYAPFASDLVNVERYEIKFELGQPFHPLEQLMAVLPPESSDALPVPLAKLMTDPESPIKDFYPKDVEIDPNGKHLPWLWVTLLPFIDEKRLLDTVSAVEDELTEAERERNSFGPSLLYVFESQLLASVIRTVIESAEVEAKAVLQAAEYNGFSGALVKPPAKVVLQLGTVITAPKQPMHAFQDIDHNRAIVAAYQLPPGAPHHSFLLPGVTLPPPKLTARDLAPRRPPRLGKGGMSIADLGAQLGYGGDSNVQAAEPMMMHAMGLNFSAFGQQQQTGNRSWGTMEPQSYKGPRPQLPFLPQPLFAQAQPGLQMPPRPSLYPTAPLHLPPQPPRVPLFPPAHNAPRSMAPQPPRPLFSYPPSPPPTAPPPQPPPGMYMPPRPQPGYPPQAHQWAPRPAAPPSPYMMMMPQQPPALIPLGATPGLLENLRQQVAATLQQRNTETGRPGLLAPPRGPPQGRY